MKRKRVWKALLILVLLIISFTGSDIFLVKAGNPMKEPSITVLYDNYDGRVGLKTDWGFACFVRGFEKNILFDTGTNGATLLNNMRKMQIKPEEIDVVVLSHWHSDHVGGLKKMMAANKKMQVYLLESKEGYENKIQEKGIAYVKATEKTEICKQVFTTGLMKGSPDEHGLVIQTPQGNILITGCAHPGICNIVSQVKQSFPQELLLVMGGFHLKSKSETEITQIVATIQELGVKYIAPSHCTGKGAIEQFAEAYQDRYFALGVGKEILLSSLE